MKMFLMWLAGVITTLLILAIIILIKTGNNNNVHYFEQPISYEHKVETSFQVFQIFDDAALAKEESMTFHDGHKMYTGKVVLIVGENFYNEQVIKVENPQQIGTYTYTNAINQQMTVPIIKP